jgi:dienelactone hydrolase
MKTLLAFTLTTLAALALPIGATAADGDKTTEGSYAVGERTISFTRFDPATPGPHPAILLLHGLDGAARNKANYHAVASGMAERGYVVFVVRYFDAFANRADELAFFREHVKDQLNATPNAKQQRVLALFNECLAVVAAGVQYARTQPGVDGERVGIVGFSLGGFLALSAATQKDLKVTAVVELFGGLPGHLYPQVGALPPVLLLHGDQDRVVPVESARRLEKALKEQGTVHQVQVYAKVGHVFEDDKGGFCWVAAMDAQQRADAFLQQHLKRP